MAKYKKKCVYCGKEYESDSRNQRYCCDECCAKAQEKNYKVKKTRARKRREYSKTEKIQRALSAAYSLAHKVAEAYDIPKVCVCKLKGEVDENNECSGDLELHHDDSNPFNNAPWNLGWYCERHHKVEHGKKGKVNVVQCYVDAEEEANKGHEMDRGNILINHFLTMVEEANSEYK